MQDVFHKLKASGFNAIRYVSATTVIRIPTNLCSVYFFWSYHSASRDVFDFETSGKNIQRLFDYAKEAGLWVISRAGPYCNAETSGGGHALWGSDGSLGVLRTSDETHYKAWPPYVTQVGKIIAKNQITNGGVCIFKAIIGGNNANST